MFGRSDENQQAQVTPINDVTAPEPTADGTLGAPAHDNTASSPTMPSTDTTPDTATPSDIDGFLPSPGEPTPPATDNNDIPVNPQGDGLLNLKQQALQQLSPLLDHLDQSAEEKFRTTMMMIQATDNQDLIKTAYEAAQKIGDEKTRAQALLDIVNEINYFTQHPTA